MRGEKLAQVVSDQRKWLLGAGTGVFAVFSAIKLGIEDLDRETLRWTGGILAGAGGARLTYRKYFHKSAFENVEKASNKTKIPTIITAAGALAFAGSFLGMGGNGENETESDRASTPATVVSSPTAANPGTESVDPTTENIVPSTFPFACEISAPIAPDDVEGVKRLQTYLNAQGYDAGPEDGLAGDQTGEAVDRLQAALGVDTATRWDALTCSLTPFGDGDPNTP